MTAVVILNIVFAVLVVGGIGALLGRAIIADNPGALRRARREPEPARTKSRSSARGALDFG
jgi:hypothetical protein